MSELDLFNDGNDGNNSGTVYSFAFDKNTQKYTFVSIK